LLKILTDHQLITASQHRLLSERLSEQSEREIGIYLVNAGYATLDQVLEVLEKEYANQLRPSLHGMMGLFVLRRERFHPMTASRSGLTYQTSL